MLLGSSQLSETLQGRPGRIDVLTPFSSHPPISFLVPHWSNATGSHRSVESIDVIPVSQPPRRETTGGGGPGGADGSPVTPLVL